MSNFKAKDLHYEKSEPAFLRRLRNNYASSDGRHNIQNQVRPKKDRLKTGDGEDDEPVIVDENGEVVGRKEFEGMVEKGDRQDKNSEETQTLNEEKEKENGTEETEETERRDKQSQQSVGIGGARKRKQIKAVGNESDDDNPVPSTPTVDQPSIKRDDTTNSDKNNKSNIKSTNQEPFKPKKKAKKIKLSFDDPE